MMINRKTRLNRVVDSVLAVMPAIPYIMKHRRRTPIAAYVLGGIGVAIAMGVAAVMLLSPRTRNRALSAAKGTYGKVNYRITHLRSAHGETPQVTESIVDQYTAPTSP